MLKRAIGDKGEAFAVKYLKKHKYKILARNYATAFGEIDIICMNKEYLCFVEVKTRKEGSLVRPGLAVNRAKKDRILKCAKHYVKFHDRKDKLYRFDIAEVTYNDKGEYFINYVENIDM